MTGNIVTFDDAIPFMPIEKLVAQIEPQQDLHGYDNPWPAGGGKNKFNIFAIETVADTGGVGSLLTQNNDGTITVKTGTQSNVRSEKFLSQLADLEVGTEYTLTADSTGDNKFIYLHNSGFAWYFGANRTITQDDLDGYVSFYASGAGGTTAVISNMMIRLSSVTDDTFAPYSNICPISGWTGLEGQRTGANLFDKTTITDNAYVNGAGVVTPNTEFFCSDYISVKPETAYYIFTDINGRMDTIRFYDANKTVIGGSAYQKRVVTTPANCHYIRINAIKSHVSADEVFFNYPSTDASYHAYTGEPISVSWQTEAGTVYDGYIDVVSGELVAEVATKTFDGSSDEVISQTPIQGYSRFAIVIPDDSITWTDQSAATGKLWSNEFKESTNIATGSGTIGIHYRVNGSHQIVVGMGTLLPDDLAQFRTWLSNNPLQVVYTLAEPIHYTLTPQQISTLLGNNTVFVDTGDVCVTYQSTSGSTPVRTSLKSPLTSYSYNSLKLFGNTFIEHGKG